MSKRPSQPVLDIIRRVAKDKGMNTAALARKVEMPRAQLKHILAGSQPMTVDELILLTQALEMDVAAMAGMPADAVADDDDGDEAEAARRCAACLSGTRRSLRSTPTATMLSNSSSWASRWAPTCSSA